MRVFPLPTGEGRYPASIQPDKPVLAVLSQFRWNTTFLTCIIRADVWSRLPDFELKFIMLTFEQVFSACRFCKMEFGERRSLQARQDAFPGFLEDAFRSGIEERTHAGQ